MGIENDGNRKLTARDIMFPVNKKLSGHALNIVQHVYTAFRDDFSRLFPGKSHLHFLYHYEEHVRKTHKPEEADLYMELSDPEAVAAFDAIIDEIRHNFDAIKKQGPAAIEEYGRRLRELIYQDR